MVLDLPFINCMMKAFILFYFSSLFLLLIGDLSNACVHPPAQVPTHQPSPDWPELQHATDEVVFRAHMNLST